MISLPRYFPYVIGLGLCVGYVVCHRCFQKKLPDLKDIIVVLTSTIGAYFSVVLMLTVILASSANLGILSGQEIIIVVGCSAVVWVAFTAVIQVFAEAFRKEDG